ncbi:adenylyl-sulfate kinase, partial [Bacillus sp. D-CC]
SPSLFIIEKGKNVRLDKLLANMGYGSRKEVKKLLKDFTGIDSPYEEPEKAELIVQTHKYSIEECAEQIVKYLQERSFI